MRSGSSPKVTKALLDAVERLRHQLNRGVDALQSWLRPAVGIKAKLLSVLQSTDIKEVRKGGA